MIIYCCYHNGRFIAGFPTHYQAFVYNLQERWYGVEGDFTIQEKMLY